MKRVSQRYLVATVAFTVAAIWTGVNIIGAFECLIVFTVVSATSGFVFRDNARLDGHRSRDSRRSRAQNVRDHPGRELSRERSASLREDAGGRQSASSPRSTRVVYDLDRSASDDEWARAADGAW
jgi:hypothetical protein